MAALTSTISLLEVPVSHCVDTYNWSRKRSVLTVTCGVFLLAIPSALGNGAVPILTNLPGFGLDFLTLMATVWNDFALPIGGFLTALFVGWIWQVDRALEELLYNYAWFPGQNLWSFLIRWICPAGIGLIVGWTFYSMF